MDSLLEAHHAISPPVRTSRLEISFLAPHDTLMRDHSGQALAKRGGFAPLPRRAIRQNIVDALLGAVFNGELREGDWLNAHKLALQFGVSATPVREALVELATMGIVEMRHNLGTVTRRFGSVQLQELYHLRGVLEAEATLCACGKIPRGELEQLNEEMTALLDTGAADWSDRAMAADRTLHALIARHCGSRRLTEEVGRYNSLMHNLRKVVGNRSQAQEKGVREHLEILNALLRKQPSRAAKAMRRHIFSTAESVKQALFPGEERAADAVAG